MKNRVISDVISHVGKGTHPRIFLTDKDFARIRESSDEVYVYAKEYTIRRADGYIDTPLLEYRIPDGIRLLQVSRDTLDRSFYLGMAYRLTGEEKYARKLWLELENAAGYKDWNPYHHLDVGEMCCAFGIGYDWIYDYLDEGQRKILRDAIVKHGFNATMDDYLDRERRRSYRWYQDEPGDNWKFVCNGGATVAALAICDEDDMDTELLRDVFGYAFENTYRAVRDMYLPDGSYAEGFTYWNYATDYLAHYVLALKSCTGTDYGLSDYLPIEKSALYVKYMCSNTFKSFNFGDAIETFMCPEVMFWIGKNYSRADITTMRRDEILKDPYIARVRDLVWYEPCERVGLEGSPKGFGAVGADNASFRSGFGEDDLYAAIHFGDNNAYHAHADMGNFVVEWKKQRFICDLGQDNYNVPKYREAYRYRAEGHNTVIINPGEGPDQERFSVCRIDEFSDGTSGDGFAVSDISAAYFGKKVRRGLKMTSDGAWIIVRDEMELDEGDSGYWFAHTRGAVTLSDDGRYAVIEQGGERMLLAILSGGAFELMEAIQLYEGHVQPDQRDNSDVKRIAIKFCGSTDISVAIAPMECGNAPERLPDDLALCDWK